LIRLAARALVTVALAAVGWAAMAMLDQYWRGHNG